MKFSIRYKFIMGLLIVFCLSFNFISVFINDIVIKNNQKVITDELYSAQKDLNIFLNQYMIINDIKNDEKIFEENYEKIGSAISSKINERIVLYSKNGDMIFDTEYNNGYLYTNNGMILEDDFQDLKYSLKGQSSYKIIKNEDTYTVIFSAPLYVHENVIGIVRYNKDYSELFINGKDMINKIKLFMMFMFCILFIFTYILSTKIVIPIIKLNKITKEISKGNFDVELNLQLNDEIGELSESFNIMKTKIKAQIETIKNDRDDLIKMEKHRKTFYDNVTHEIKTPLTIIDGYAQMILDEDELEEKLVIKAASKIKKESNKLHTMVVDVLNMSKLESMKDNDFMEKINMSEVINKISDEMSIKANKYQINIKKDLKKNVYIYANEEDISSMVVNIIDNSIKYANVKSIIKINLNEDEKNCIISFEDEGQGIDNDTLKRIFEPFYRGNDKLKNKTQGNGLGLAIVKSIVNKYNGKINIESEINKGTKVNIKIPLCLQVGNKLIN